MRTKLNFKIRILISQHRFDMPSKPKKINRSYKPETKPFERSVNNSWFYNSYKWRKFTKSFKIRNPLCVLDCKDLGIETASTVVDHKEQFKPGALGWDLNNLKDENYNAACDNCHNKKSGKQRHGL